MTQEQQDKEDIETILNHLRLNHPEKATIEEATHYLAIMKTLAKQIVDKDPDFAELLLQAMEEAKKKKDNQN